MKTSMNHQIWLVGGIPTPLKTMKVSWDYCSQYMEKKNVPNHQPEHLLTIKFGVDVQRNKCTPALSRGLGRHSQ